MNNIEAEDTMLQRIELVTPHPSKFNLDYDQNEAVTFPKITGIKLEFQIKPDVTLVKSARRKIRLSMQSFVNSRLLKMLDLGTLERALKASNWISPMHIVRKSNEDTRIVIDMREPNLAL